MRKIIFLNEESNNDFLNKLNQVYDKLEPIKYGSVHKNGKIYFDDPQDVYDDDNTNYPQKPLDTLKYKVGHCIDQSEVARYLLDKAGIKNQVYAMFPARGT